MIGHHHDVLVIGGGISGLTVAWQLQRAGADVCLLEASHTVGGCTQTDSRDGFLIEKGPFNVLVRDPVFEDLLAAHADRLNVITGCDTAKKRYIYKNGKLHAVPASPIALATTPLLSLAGKLRLIRGLLLSKCPGCDEPTIDEFTTRRFGAQVADTFVSALISGIFAGDINRLSLNACLPSLCKLDHASRSPLAYELTRRIRDKRTGRKRRWKGLVSVNGGLGALTRAMGEALGDSLITGANVASIHSHAGEYAVNTHVNGSSTPLTLRSQELVLATPAPITANLLRPLETAASQIIGSIESASLTVINLGFKRTDIGHPLDGYGFLVPRTEREMPILGSLWASTVFPHQAPADRCLIRVFLGGTGDPQAVDRTDDQLLNMAMTALRTTVDARGEPVMVDISRYRKAIPQYHVGHADKIDSVRSKLATHPHLHLTGNFLEGVSLNDCVRLGARVADDVLAALNQPALRRQTTEKSVSKRPQSVAV